MARGSGPGEALQASAHVVGHTLLHCSSWQATVMPAAPSIEVLGPWTSSNIVHWRPKMIHAQLQPQLLSQEGARQFSNWEETCDSHVLRISASSSDTHAHKHQPLLEPTMYCGTNRKEAHKYIPYWPCSNMAS